MPAPRLPSLRTRDREPTPELSPARPMIDERRRVERRRDERREGDDSARSRPRASVPRGRRPGAPANRSSAAGAPESGYSAILPRMKISLVLGLALAAGPLRAQTAPPRDRAAATITAGDVARHIGIIADDSMLGRDTPSRGLELTAQYVADQFQAVRLADRVVTGGSWFQRYPITRPPVRRPRGRVSYSRPAAPRRLPGFDRTARYVQGPVPAAPLAGTAVLVGGTLEADDVSRMALRGRIVIYAPGAGTLPSERATRVTRALRLAAPKAVLLISDLEPETFASRIPHVMPARTTVDLRLTSPPLLESAKRRWRPSSRPRAWIRGHAGGYRGGLPGAAGAPGARSSSRTRCSPRSRRRTPWAFSRAAILRSSASTSSSRPTWTTSASRRGQPDSINNGADDDASGTTGVIELAEAFSRPGARPRRSIIFLTVSGEEKGLWGSRYFTRAPAGADRADRGGHQHRHDRAQLAGHDRGDREGALGSRRDARAGQRRRTRSWA